MPTRILMLLENNTYLKDVRVRNEANSLVAAGHEVTVICPRDKDNVRYKEVDGVRLYFYPAPPDGDGLVGYIVEYGYSLWMALWLSLRVLFKHGFDVIHAHNPPDVYVLLAIVYKLFGKRFVFDHHDLSPELYYYARFGGEGRKLVYNMLVFFEKLSCRVADYVIATNESYKKVDIERANIAPEKVYIVRNGPKMADMAVESKPKNDTSKIVIGYLGIIGFQDGADVLVQAIYHLVNDLHCEDFQCVLAGSGDALDAVKALASELGVSDYINFTGWVDYNDVPKILSSFDICAAPELSNIYADRSTVIKIMEYMAFAKPIVAFDLPEHRASAGEAALYASDNNPAKLAELILNLINDPDLRRKLGEIGKERIENELSWTHQAAQLLALYDNFSQNRPK